MATIWVLVESYSSDDYLIQAAFSSKEKAEAYVLSTKTCRCKQLFCGHTDYWIVDLELDKFDLDEL